MTRSTVTRLRALGLGLVAVLLVLAAAKICTDRLGRGAAVADHRTGPAVVDQESAIVVSTAAEAKSMSGWMMPLAALGAAVALTIGFFSRRDVSVERAGLAARRRLVRARRRAPPAAPVLHVF